MAQWINWGDGHDGSPNAISGTVNTYAACTGTSGQAVLTTALAASAGDQILVHQTQHATAAGTWEIVKVVSDAGATLNLATALVNSYSTGAQAVLIPQYTGGDISGAVTGTAWNGTVGGIIALMSNGDLTISGSISINGNGFAGGAAVGGPQQIGKNGNASIGNGQSQTTSANGMGAGGGGKDTGNGNGAGGGGGGYAASGSAGSVGDYHGSETPGSAGGSGGTANLTTIIFGGGGGGGGQNYEETAGSGCAGGTSGGIILIIGKNTTISGTLSANGAVGGAATGSWDGGAGGGAGGSVLIKCQTAVLGTNKITATGGAGGAGGNGTGSSAPNWANGGAGAVGRIRCDYFTSVSGSTTPTLSSAQDLTLTLPTSNFFAFF